MAELPIMPLKTDALLADTTHMSAEEFGVYCRLLFVMWRHGGRLKDDDSELAIIGGVTSRRWQAIKEKVMRPMTAIGGVISQGRLTDTWQQVQELRKKRALAADIRWKGKPRPRGMQMHNQMDSNSNANQNQRIEPSLSEDRPSDDAPMQKGSAGGDLKISPQLAAILARSR